MVQFLSFFQLLDTIFFTHELFVFFLIYRIERKEKIVMIGMLSSVTNGCYRG